MSTRQWWRISIGGYGAFAYYGDELEAEEMRAHKARWEGGAGSKQPIDADDPMVVMEVLFRRRERERGTPMDERELEAIGETP